MSESQRERWIVLGNDTTLRWSCRGGDVLIWARCSNPMLTAPDNSFGVIDAWEMRDGQFVTVTNRTADLPEWFDLHPTEVSNALAPWMTKRLSEGYAPEDAVQASNLWRLCVGDRLAWVGKSRPDMTADNGVLRILECRACALAVGESQHVSAADLAMFGDISAAKGNSDAVAACRHAMELICRKGIPRRWSDHWVLG